MLDCDKPEFLMYYDTPQGKGLAGLMFYMDTPAGWGEQIGGPLTIWHYHVWAPIQCMEREPSVLWSKCPRFVEAMKAHN